MNQTNEPDQIITQDQNEAENGEISQCEAKAQEYLNGWQRAKADFINYKNEEAKRLEDMARFITRSLVQDLFAVLDSFDMAVKHFGIQGDGNEGNTEQEKGILLIRSQFTDILKKRGLEVITITPGEPFNPEKHEALGEIESNFPAGSVVEEIQKGYALQGHVVRPARVRVGK